MSQPARMREPGVGAAEPVSARERLLDAAEHLLNTGSLHGAGVDAIVRAAGSARKSFYAHFASKNALIEATLARRDERWMAAFRRAAEASASTPVARLLGIFDVLAAWFGSSDFHGCMFLNAAGEIKARDDAVFAIAVRHKKILADYLCALCAQAGAGEPRRLAGHLSLIVDGAISVAMLSGRPDAAHDAAQIARCLLQAEGLMPARDARSTR